MHIYGFVGGNAVAGAAAAAWQDDFEESRGEEEKSAMAVT